MLSAIARPFMIPLNLVNFFAENFDG